MMRIRRQEGGFAVIVAMMGLLMMSALGMALALSSSIETLIARNFRDGAGASYAAEALALQSIYELSGLTDWTPVLNGGLHSTFFDGFAPGVRRLSDGSAINLEEILNRANCGKTTMCSEDEITAVDNVRPWGATNPHWLRFASGRLQDLLGVPSPFYVVVLVADDPAETDLNPFADGSDSGNPGSGVLLLRAEAFGPGGVHAPIEATVARRAPEELASRPGAPTVRIVSWRAAR